MEVGSLYKICNRIRNDIVFYHADNLVSYMETDEIISGWMLIPSNTIAIYIGTKSGRTHLDRKFYTVFLFIWENRIMALLPEDYDFIKIHCD